MMKLSEDQKEDIKLIARSKRTNSPKLINSYLDEMIQRDMCGLSDRKWSTNASDYLCPICHERSICIELVDNEHHELIQYRKEQTQYVAQCLSCEAESTPHDTLGLARRNVLPYEEITKIKTDLLEEIYKGEVTA